jgi:hypothetical protein
MLGPIVGKSSETCPKHENFDLRFLTKKRVLLRLGSRPVLLRRAKHTSEVAPPRGANNFEFAAAPRRRWKRVFQE